MRRSGNIFAIPTVDGLELGLSFLDGLVLQVFERSISIVGTEVQAGPY